MSAIDELQAAIQAVATRVGPAVVGIAAHRAARAWSSPTAAS